MSNYDNTNKGSLFINKDKSSKAAAQDTTKWSDWSGVANINGVEYYVSAWKGTIQKGDMSGQPRMALGFKPVNESAPLGPPASKPHEAPDDLPW